MNFTITRSDGSDDIFSDAQCSRDGGVLVVEDGDRHIVYGPGGWVRIEADEEIYSSTTSVAVEGSVGREPVFVSVTPG